MHFTSIALVCCLVGCVMAYPNPNPEEKLRWEQPEQRNDQQQQRFQLDGGYNSDKSGKDFHVEGQVPVWTSENKRHEIDIAGHYGQHYGGPYGNSPPQYGFGGGYRFRF
ncbi:hypothetical protein KR093_001859 [Drosophila rubida]|uniref:Diptericin A n=1 Tax=Drosophila rubida TaxID=30044 RepID=A0AAD4PKC0_9MUSC|nr:hypothetical protein KR093_001859 [Drosophila rubida]